MNGEVPFFNIPASLFSKLRERIAETSDDETVAGDALRSLGHSWAMDTIQDLGLTSDMENIRRDLQQFCIQVGVLKVDMTTAGAKAMEVTVRETEVNDTDIMMGFISGTVSGLLGSEYKIEVSDPDGPTFFLTPAYMTAVPEDTPSGPIVDGLENGEAYLISDNSQATEGFRHAISALDNGRSVYCITRVFPPKARSKLPRLDECAMAWLSDTDVKSGTEDFETFSPKRPDFELSRSLIAYLRGAPNCFVLLHGVEYLISQTSFPTVEKFLHKMKDVAVTNQAVLLCSVSPDALGNENYSKLSAEFTTLDR